MTSPTAKANSANIDARQRLAELLIRDIKEASAAENLMIRTVEVLEAMLENAQ